MSVSKLFDLSGKTALVTGSRRGLGRAMALGLAQAGADILGVSTHQEADGGQLGEEIRAMGCQFQGFSCDLGQRSSVESLLTQVRHHAPKIDILINCAGTILRKPAIEHPDEYFDQVLEVNLRAQFVLTREIAKGMLERRSGKIVFLASMLSFQGGVNVPGYAASKGGIASLTKALANEWASQGINVNAIAPGYMATDNTAALQADPVRSATIMGRIPAARWGQPEDLVGAAIFLSSPASDYVHGTVLTVDGGWMGR